jgi:hypothetical protein
MLFVRRLTVFFVVSRGIEPKEIGIHNRAFKDNFSHNDTAIGWRNSRTERSQQFE